MHDINTPLQSAISWLHVFWICRTFNCFLINAFFYLYLVLNLSLIVQQGLQSTDAWNLNAELFFNKEVFRENIGKKHCFQLSIYSTGMDISISYNQYKILRKSYRGLIVYWILRTV